MEERHDGEDSVGFVAREGLELAELEALGYDVVVREHNGFGETGGTTREVEVATDLLVGLAVGNSPM